MPKMIFGKTIYVFGAGASLHVGAPLLIDFLVTARTLYNRNLVQYKSESFKLIFDWIDELKSASYYLDLDLDNIEHVFSIAEMHKQIGGLKSEELYSALIDVIAITLDHCQVMNVDNVGLAFTTEYAKFADKLDKWRKMKEAESMEMEEDTLVSFNYDPFLDFSVYKNSERKINYCLNPTASDGVKILKLHGSCNWYTCKNCEESKRRVVPILKTGSKLVEEMSKKAYAPITRGNVRFELYNLIIRHGTCDVCGQVGSLEPYIIPPTWSKRIVNPELRNVWRAIVEEVKKAYQMIIIGYSMPQTDTFFQYLLTLGLKENNNLNRVVIVNPDKSGELEARYRGVFSRSMTARGRIFFEDVTFEEFVEKRMGDYLYMSKRT